MPARGALFGRVRGIPLCLGLAMLASCGWAPLYADRETGPVDAELRAIRVAPIPERVGQKLALALRNSLNPTGEPTPQRYVLYTTLTVSRADLGVITQGLGTRSRLDANASIVLRDIKTGQQLMAAGSHVADAFDIQANEYADIVAEDDARTRVVEELRGDIINRLTVFLQRRVAAAPPKP